MLNIIIGLAKLANIYISRRYKILYDSDCVVELVFKGLIKARIRHDFTLYLSMKKVQIFEDIWSRKLAVLGCLFLRLRECNEVFVFFFF